MKKNRLLVLIILLTLFLSFSCQKKTIKEYNINEKEEFIKLVYDSINDEKQMYCAFEFRTKENYENGHIRQFRNYDLSVGNVDDFLNYMKSNYSDKVKVIIMCEDDEIINALKKYYNDLYIYHNSYETLGDVSSLFTIDKGPYNCMC